MNVPNQPPTDNTCMTESELIIHALQQMPGFAQLSLASFHHVEQHLQSMQLTIGDALFHQGDQDTDMFIITHGRVKAVLPDEHGRELLLDEYGPGQLIGELALLSQQPRAATIVATQPTTLAKLTRATYLHLLESFTDVELDSIDDFHRYLRQRYKIRLLKRIDWFAVMPSEELTRVADKLHAKSFNPNDILFQRGDTGDAFYIIIQGWVSAFINSHKGSLIILNQLGPGEIFGEMALLEDKPRSAGIVALTPVEVLTLNRSEFLAVLQEHAPIALETLRSLSGKLRFSITYLEKAVDWSQRIADGDYSMVLDQIKITQDDVMGASESDDFRITAFLSAFMQLIQGVQQRENSLRQEISALKLKIEIDEDQRQEQVQAITQNPFFSSLKAKAQKMRHDSANE